MFYVYIHVWIMGSLVWAILTTPYANLPTCRDAMEHYGHSAYCAHLPRGTR